MLRRIGLDPFVLAIMAMIGLAAINPTPGLGDGPWSLGELSGYAVSGIFFFYGLRLSVGQLSKSLSLYKLHLLVQCSSFIFFPLILLATRPFFAGGPVESLWLGSYFLAALPSTVSSSVVMVSIARGNIPAAIFNASISSLLGVFITPVWMQLVINDLAGAQSLGPIVFKLILQVLAPVILGMLMNKWGGGFAEKYKVWLKYFDQLVILVIVYTAFCKAFDQKLFAGLSPFTLIGLLLAMGILFWTMLLLIRWCCRRLHFNREDTITAVFCGSKKSLVHGTVLSKVLFAGNPMTALLLLPLMVYHAFQLIMASILARKWSKEEPLAGSGLLN